MDGAYEPSSVDELNKEDKNSLSFLNKETERKYNLADIKYTLLSGVSLLTLTACGGGGGAFGALWWRWSRIARWYAFKRSCIWCKSISRFRW